VVSSYFMLPIRSKVINEYKHSLAPRHVRRITQMLEFNRHEIGL
jgi:hypothetical protein